MESNTDDRKKSLGITVRKSDNMSEWYTQVVLQSELADYSPVSGCIVYRPLSYAIWENVQRIFDSMIKSTGHKNVYFPMLIPESLMNKEEEHIEGFAPEVAWVTRGGNSELSEPLAIRPTSETIIYDSMSKWIRSHRDLPLLLNQWCSVVRWEFKHPRPFLRGREFLWQEGHTAHTTYEEAVEEVMMILEYYRTILEDYYAMPVLIGKKSEQEKFAGAHYTLACEAIMPDGKSLQVCTSHHMGTNFSEEFDLQFSDADGQIKHAYTTSWGISTRTIGGLILVHGDDKGLIIPPKIAPLQCVIVPIYNDTTKKDVLEYANTVKNMVESVCTVSLDARDYVNPGYKYNEHELKGVPIRIEAGPRDIENNNVIMVRRDTGEKKIVSLDEISDTIVFMLNAIQENLYKTAKERHDAMILLARDYDALEKAISDKKVAFSPFCGSAECESTVKDKTGAISLVFPLMQPHGKSSCIICNAKGSDYAYFGKSY
ncbi:MAG: proline--tRNA ligase [Candidatus Woesearchaeota archaeon]